MPVLLELQNISHDHESMVGGKAASLAVLFKNHFDIPATLCLSTRGFDQFMSQTRIRDKIMFELNRFNLDTVRWEELWDTALRIRNMFLNTDFPKALENDICRTAASFFNGRPLVVRSSAPGEDSRSHSFAGIHDSFLNINGRKDLLKAVKLVWASLYSDAALLYRKDLNLDINAAKMAVVLQEMIPSDRSGILFTKDPSDTDLGVLESVYGLNQALVDGDVEPDRWQIKRKNSKIISHTAAKRIRLALPDQNDIQFQPLPDDLAGKPPLTKSQVRQVWDCGLAVESIFGQPQDIEFCFEGSRLVILQARPVTSGKTDQNDKKSWYLSLHRSLDNLKKLYKKINQDLIPEMVETSGKLGAISLEKLGNSRLADEINQRQEIYDHWVRVYWSDFIPFAHGIRLFGQYYNDMVQPEDPYEFMRLLEKTDLKSTRRNRLIQDMAHMIKKDAQLRQTLEAGIEPPAGHRFSTSLNDFIEEFGDLSCTTGTDNDCQYGAFGLIKIILEYAERPDSAPDKRQTDIETLKRIFLEKFPEGRQHEALEILELGRESFRLRDDDNIHLGRIESRLFEAVQEGRKRISQMKPGNPDFNTLTAVPALAAPAESSVSGYDKKYAAHDDHRWVKMRQLVGHPAGPGIAKGPARVIKQPSDLLAFQSGEVLVCAGVDPTMTFVVPLSCAVVESRGGMLIHGAIIAREYGLPCVTGAPNITELVKTGDIITVDGYLGLITCDTKGVSII